MTQGEKGLFLEMESIKEEVKELKVLLMRQLSNEGASCLDETATSVSPIPHDVETPRISDVVIMEDIHDEAIEVEGPVEEPVEKPVEEPVAEPDEERGHERRNDKEYDIKRCKNYFAVQEKVSCWRSNLYGCVYFVAVI